MGAVAAWVEGGAVIRDNRPDDDPLAAGMPDARAAWAAIASADRLRADARRRFALHLEEALAYAVDASGVHPDDVRDVLEELVARRRR